MTSRAHGRWAWIWLGLCMVHVAIALDRILADGSTASVLGNLGLAAIALCLGAVSAETARRWPNG